MWGERSGGLDYGYKVRSVLSVRDSCSMLGEGEMTRTGSGHTKLRSSTKRKY